MNDKLTEIQKEIETRIRERAEQRASYSKKLEDAKTAIRLALEKKAAMISAEDRKGVRAAMEEAADARAAEEIYQTKLDDLPEKPVVDYAEAERLLDRVCKIHGEKEKEILKKAKAHVEALLKLNDEYTTEANEAEDLAQRICFSLFDGDEYYLMSKGKRVMKKKISVVGSRNFSFFIDKIRTQELLKPLFGIEPKREVLQNWGVATPKEEL